MESVVERRGKLLEFEAGAKTDGSGLSTLIWSSQRCLPFLCIMSLCCHPTGLSWVRDCRIKLITCREKKDRRDGVTDVTDMQRVPRGWDCKLVRK